MFNARTETIAEKPSFRSAFKRRRCIVPMTAFSGKGRLWTIRELQSIPESWEGDTISDGGGLSGKVRVGSDGGVSIRFQYAFRWESRITWFQCGTWPRLDLAEIRRNRDDAREKVKLGINPTTDKIATKIEAQAAREAVIADAEANRKAQLTVDDLFSDWIADGVARKDDNKCRRAFKSTQRCALNFTQGL
jgi:hypothetical protein